MIIISDIHGRSYWKHLLKRHGILKDGKVNEPVLFMGDYLDHYPHEYDPYLKNFITNTDEVSNFEEILDLKKNNLENVILLLGNHDMEYISSECVACRMNYSHQDQIKKLFEENLSLFKVGYFTYVGERFVTCTHANICLGWAKRANLDSNPIQLINYLNTLVNKENKEILGHYLHHVGTGRGGDYPQGSCVWADLQDYAYDDDKSTKFYQVVAHTQHMVRDGKFVYDDYTFCTDCHVEEMGNRPIFRLLDSWEPLENKEILTCLKPLYDEKIVLK